MLRMVPLPVPGRFIRIFNMIEGLFPSARAEGSTTLADPLPALPAAVSAVKEYLRIEGSAEDALLARLIAVAIEQGERWTGRSFVRRQMRMVVRSGPGWQRLGPGPVTWIGAIERWSPDGIGAALPVSAFHIDIDGIGDGWVRVRDTSIRRVRVTFTAGMAEEWSEMPEPLAQGVLRLAAHLYTHRDTRDEAAPPAAIAALWRPWRRLSLA